MQARKKTARKGDPRSSFGEIWVCARTRSRGVAYHVIVLDDRLDFLQGLKNTDWGANGFAPSACLMAELEKCMAVQTGRLSCSGSFSDVLSSSSLGDHFHGAKNSSPIRRRGPFHARRPVAGEHRALLWSVCVRYALFTAQSFSPLNLLCHAGAIGRIQNPSQSINPYISTGKTTSSRSPSSVSG